MPVNGLLPSLGLYLKVRWVFHEFFCGANGKTQKIIFSDLNWDLNQ
jgi:hypothetical protein